MFGWNILTVVENISICSISTTKNIFSRKHSFFHGFQQTLGFDYFRRVLSNKDLFERLLTVRIPLPPRKRAFASMEKPEFFLASKSPEKGDATGFLASGIFSVMNRCLSTPKSTLFKLSTPKSTPEIKSYVNLFQ